MDNKKKQCGRVFFKLQFVLLFFMALGIYLYLFSGNSYAITENELYESFEKSTVLLNDKENVNYFFNRENFNYTGVNNWGFSFESFLTLIDGFNFVFSDYVNYGSVSSPNYVINLTFFNYNSDVIDLGNNQGISGDYYKCSFYFNSNSLFIGGTSIQNGYFTVFNDRYMLIHNFDFKYNNILYPSNINFIIPDSITLEALHSGSKFTFTFTNQLKVTFTGNYTIYDFIFGIEQYNNDNDSWRNVTGLNDWYYEDSYENPYYVFFTGLNYLSVGTYRYIGVFTGDEPFSVYSNTFEITSSVISDNGTVTGTINGDGNVDLNVNVNNGNSVDNIKDFFGTPANFDNTTVTQEDIANSINIEQTVSPYDNFVLTFINGLISSLTEVHTNDFIFKVHTWGDTYIIRVGDIIPNYGEDLTNFLRLMSIIVFGFVIVRWSTKLIEALNVGDVSKSLELIEEKYSDLL